MTVPVVSRAPNCTILGAGPGLTQAASTPHALHTRRPCCPTARSLLQRGQAKIVTPLVSRARNSTTRQAGAGFAPSASTPDAIVTRRPCCPTAWSWLQGVKIIQIIPWLLRARNSTRLRRRPHQRQRRRQHLPRPRRLHL